MSKLTKRITAMLLAGMLVIGSVPVAVFAASTDVDPGQTSEIAQEVYEEESSEAPAGEGETAEIEETSEVPMGAGGTAESEEPFEEPASVGETAEEASAEEAQYYTVTLDANGGYFENEWDDAIGDYTQQAEVVEKHIPVDGTVTAFPVFIDQDGQTMLFAGWSLERDGELVTMGDEEYAPVDNCVLYAVWQAENTSLRKTGGREVADEGTEQTDAAQRAEEVENVLEETVTAKESPVEEDTVFDSNSDLETENEQDITSDQEAVSADEDVENISEDLLDVAVEEEETQPELNEPSREEETVSEETANGVVKSGMCGDNLTWTIDEEGILTISGTGEMEDYDDSFSSCVYRNYSVKTVIIESGVTSIGDYAFYRCNRLTSVTIPNSVTSIGKCAFEYCMCLTSVTIPNSVTSIGDYAFSFCESLNSFVVESGNLNYSSENGVLFNKDQTVIISWPSGKGGDCQIPNSVTSIGDCAFYGCSSLTSVTIPNSVTSIGRNAFYGCNSLTSVTIPNSVTSIGDYAFMKCESLNTLIVESGNLNYSSENGVLFNKDQTVLISWPSGKGGDYQIPNSVTSIGNYAFEYCSSLTSVTIPNSVTSIGDCAFGGSGLTSVTIPNSVTSIGDWAFCFCNSLTSVTIPNSVTSIGDRAFSLCSYLSSIHFSGNAPSIGSLVFENVTATAYYPANNPTWTEDVRQNYGGDITWVESDPGVDDGIKSLVPSNNAVDVDHSVNPKVVFSDALRLSGNGHIYLYESNNSTPVEIIDAVTSSHAVIIEPMNEEDTSSTLDLFFDTELKPNTKYTISIDSDSLEYLNWDSTSQEYIETGNLYAGIEKGVWSFTTASIDYMHFTNQTDEIDESLYYYLFKPGKAFLYSHVWDSSRGKEGTCYGWAYTVGAKRQQYNSINAFGGKLCELKKDSLNLNNNYSLLNYIQMAYLYQFSERKLKEDKQNEDKYDRLYQAIKNQINGNGEDIIIAVYEGKKSHALYPIKIISDNENEITVQVLDCNRPDDSYFANLILKKESNEIKGYEYKTYDDHISYDTIDNVLDSAFSDPSRAEQDTTNLVYSPSSLNDANLNEILPMGDAVSESNLYWTEQTSVTQSAMENTTIGMTDGYSLIETNVENAADVTIDVSTNTASVESIGDSSVGFSISYTTYDVDGIKNEMTITSETEKGVETQQTEDGIVISSEGNNHVEVSDGDNTVGFETNDASVLVKTDGAITVYEDSNNDGSYTNAVEVTPIGKTKINDNNTTINYSNDLTFNGNEIKAVDTVAYGNISLSEGTDYTITYTDNTNVGTATVTITGIGNYEGTVTKTFTINPAAIDTAEISEIEPVTYKGKEQTPVPTVKIGEQTLKKDTDYTVTYSNNTAVGTATVTITGKGNYTGTVSKTFTISAASIANATVSGISNKTYTGSALTQNPTVKVGDQTLVNKTDYTVSYQNNTNVGTATVTITGKGNYASKRTVTFKINKAAQSITAKAGASRVAVGKTTTVSITGNKGSKSYKSSNTAIATVTSAGKITAKKVGTVKITATSAATANYNAASKTVTIKVVPAATASLTAANQATGIKLTWKKVTGANGYKIYRGSTLIKTITSGNTVTFADTKANTNGTKYTYKVLAKATSGDSTLSRSRVIYRVARPAISSATNSASKKMTVKWGKNAKANGYQIQYSTDKTFKTGNKAVSITSASTVSKVIGNLTKSKTYYVRIRTYKTVGSTKYWSIWSAARSVKISK